MALEDQVAKAETAESVIGNELGGLRAGIERLEHQVGRLQAKIAPALGGPIPQAVPSSDVEPDFFGSEIAKSIHVARRDIGAVTDAVVEIIDRLET
jgi:hypothetical protein